MIAPVIDTLRLRLRPVEPTDLDAAAAMWADEGVVRYIGGKPRTRQEVWFAMLRGAGLWVLKGYGYWVITDRETGEFYGEAGFADFLRGLPADLAPGPAAGWASPATPGAAASPPKRSRQCTHGSARSLSASAAV